MKLEFSKKLESYLPQKAKLEDYSEYNSQANYFKSLHYSRVRVGQRYFMSAILLNPIFREKFETIFRLQSYEDCDIARKNENSKVPFSKRKAIISEIISQYQRAF